MEHSFLLDAYRHCAEVLSEIALGATQCEIFETLQTIVEGMDEARFASILRLDPHDGTLHLTVDNRLPRFYNKAIQGLKVGPKAGSCGAAAFTAKPVIVDDLLTHENWYTARDLVEQARLSSCWSVPIILSKGEVYGTFAIYSSAKATPREEELEILTLCAHIAGVVIEKQRSENQLTFNATHDPLTKLSNRSLFDNLASQALRQTKRKREPLCVLFIDINNFKHVNDQYGHDMGDRLLCLLSDVLKQELREADIASRRGGDEFILALVGTEKEGAKILIDRFCQHFEEAQKVLFNDYVVTLAIGISESKKGNYQTISELIKQADVDMYRNKRSLENKY
ncbi:hypothetical protein A9Q77_10930 [Marinomonas sp. 42_23_T18]|nr:hypothetical protein A9Q77_10930 [Marinomonas sp. 42_23_T18]